MAEEIGFENGRNSNFQGLVTLTLDPAIRHTVVHHSSTSTYIPNFIQIKETFCGRTDGRTYGHFSPYIIWSTFGSRPKNLIFVRIIRKIHMPPFDSLSPEYSSTYWQQIIGTNSISAGATFVRYCPRKRARILFCPMLFSTLRYLNSRK